MKVPILEPLMLLQPYYQFIGRNTSVYIIMNKATFASTLVIKLEWSS